ncbi:MAG: MFS transporter, partial [FCB group bacterium]|nr:MFS transporter [FCB group bacterium]
SVGGVAHWLRQKERGTIMGVWSTSYLIGNMLVKSLGGFLLGAQWHVSLFGYADITFGGWRWSFWGCTLIAFVIWWVIYFWQRTKPQDVGLEPIVGTLEKTGTSVDASNNERVSFAEYLQVALNPIVLSMGLAYFCIKFMRYSLDLWLPAFLQIQGFSAEKASYFSQIFDIAGLAGVILAGWALDRVFRGQWAKLCFVMGIGMVVGYVAVIQLGTTPAALAIWFGLVGFMLYGPDTLLCGAASVEVAGNNNAVAVAGVVNGLGSIGPIFQTEIIGWLVGGTEPEAIRAGMRTTNFLTLGMSVAFTVLMGILAWHLSRRRRALAG